MKDGLSTLLWHPAGTEALPLYTFPSLSAFARLHHVVATRRGGVSHPPYDSLNMSISVGDGYEAVQQNQRRLCEAVGIRWLDVVGCGMVHGTDVARVGVADRGRIVQRVDGLMTDEVGVPLLLRYADCVPILLYDPARHAVALAHAGWRGTVAGMAAKAVGQMQAAFGSRPYNIHAAIGPAVGPCCYEVGADVVNAVHSALDDPATLLPQNGNGRYHFDLWAANARQLQAAGVVHVEVAGVCTACHRDNFFSHRGDNGRTGRFGIMVMLA